jgi:glycine hydroxymethyltransferase
VCDFKKQEAVAADFCPKLIVSGGSAYPREWDYKRMRALADSVGALFMCDMAHISGLVAGKVVDSPFEVNNSKHL